MDFTKMSLKEIKDLFITLRKDEALNLLPFLIKDERKTIQQFAKKIEQEYNKSIAEEIRIRNMMVFENSLIKEGYKTIAGIDEAGRGPLAGPVVASAVILPNHTFIDGIDDSKKLSPKKREDLYNIITELSIDIGIGIVDNEIIDKINIFNATKLAMKKAVENLVKTPDYLLIDAVHLDDYPYKQKSIIKGDSRSISIAASSIVSKVTRDRIMDNYSKIYPEYGFEKHKGYGTKEHYEAIRKFGITEIHRRSFLKEFI